MPLALNKIQVSELRSLCAKAENAGELTAAILKIIYREKWFKLFVPKALGGLELSLPEALQYEEYLAYIDGSLGWTVTLCAGANLFCGYIEKKKAAAVFSKEKVCFGGSGAASGVAQKTKDGYLINGYWRYATGAPHLTHFTANCVIEEKGKVILTEGGQPLVCSFFFNKKDVTVHPDWDTMGLKATAGHSFSVKNLKVNQAHSFVIDEKSPATEASIFKYPFMPFAEATIAVNTLGMARHFLDEAAAFVEQRYHSKNPGKEKYQRPIAEINAARQAIEQLSGRFYEAVASSWHEMLHQKKISAKSMNTIGRLSRKLVKACRRSVADIIPYCGLAAAGEASELNRVFRDIFTGSQHSLLTF